jgi:arginine/serine-rich splicing factor 7
MTLHFHFKDMSKDHSTRVYVGNLGSSGDKSELQREFSKFGHVRDVWVARNPPGFAFVEFEDYRDAEDAVKELDGRRVCGVRVRVEVSSHQGRSSRQQPPADRGRSRYGPDNRYNKGQRNYDNYNDDSEDKFSRR